MALKFTPLILFSIIPYLVFSQVGGDNVYEFLNLPPSARSTALGGSLINVSDGDVALAIDNPAALNPEMHQQISFNHNFHLAGITNGYASFGYFQKKWETTFHGGVQYTNYGDFNAADEFGVVTGDFTAAEYSVVLGAAHQLYERLSVGANLKFITSQFEGYNSMGLAGDIGAFYQDTSRYLSMGLVIKNIGTQLTTYVPDNAEPLPYDVQFGISKRLRYLPFRIGLTIHNLNRWNITYDDPNSEEVTFIFDPDDPVTENKFGIWVDNMFRHTIFNGAFLLGRKDNFRLRIAYNHFRRREMTVSTAPRSLAGFSMGFGMKIKQFRIDFGHAFYHLAGGTNHFSISTNLREFRRL